MEVKVIFSLGESDAPIFAELLAVLAKGNLTSQKQEEKVEEALDSNKGIPFEVVEEAKPTKKSSKSKAKKVEPVVDAGVDLAEGKDSTVVDEVKIEVETYHATLEDIRGIARKLADSGRQGEYKVILEKYGYAKVNLIEEKDYDAIYSEMVELVGEGDA